MPDEWTDFRCTNTLYYQGVSGSTSGQAVAQSIADAYAAASWEAFSFGAILVKAYDFNGVAPSGPPVAQATAAQAATPTPGPREVACALSYRAGPSTPRSRGRIFLGPIRAGAMNSDYVTGMVGNAANSLGLALMQIVTLGAQWSLYSRTVQGFAAITNFSVDNAWDTQRSRGIPPTANF